MLREATRSRVPDQELALPDLDAAEHLAPAAPAARRRPARRPSRSAAGRAGRRRAAASRRRAPAARGRTAGSRRRRRVPTPPRGRARNCARPQISSDSRSTLRSDRGRRAEQRRVDRHAAAARRRDLAPAGEVGVAGLDADRLRELRQQVVPGVQRAAAGDRRGLLAHRVSRTKRVCMTSRASVVTSRRARVLAGRVEPVGPDEVRVVQAELRRLRVHQARERREVGRDRERERVGRVVRRLDQRALQQVARPSSARRCARSIDDSPTAAARGSTVTTSVSLWCCSVNSTVISFVSDAIGRSRVGVRRGEHLAGAGVLDDVGRRAHRRRARRGPTPAGRHAATSTARQSASSHLSRILSPMKSDVECTFGLSRTIVATGTPDFEEITANVSPARTIQKRFAGALRGRRGVVVATTCFRGGARAAGGRRAPSAAGLEAGADQHDGDRRREQERRRGDVAAPVVGEHYQPEAAQISCLSRAASAPAASR